MKAFSFRLSLRERNGAIRTPIAASKGSATGRALALHSTNLQNRLQ